MIRIVKLTFREDAVDSFIEIFNESKTKIRSFAGCQRLELLHDIDNPNIFFTYSYWDNSTSLEEYRTSELFESVWAKTKILFDDKPEAWSVDRKEQLT